MTVFRYSKVTIIIKVVTIIWLLTKLYSYKLWISERIFPVIPVFTLFSDVKNSIHLSLYAGSLFFLTLILILPISKKIISIFLIFEVASCLLDYSRWQPWEYQYLLMFMVFACSANNKQFLKLISILVCFTYIFSGLHKLNGGFLYVIWDTMILHNLLDIKYLNHNLYMHYMGIAIPIIEIAIGIGLLIVRNKKYFIAAAIVMHLFIIYLLSPFGINYNEIVIPWNLVMLILVFILFYNTNINFFENIRPFRRLDFVTILLVCCLPILNFFNCWDHYLSFNLYSGKVPILIIQIDEIEKYPDLKKYISQNKIYKTFKNSSPLSVNKMMLDELKVPLYCEYRVCAILKNEWNLKFTGTENRFMIYKYPFKQDDIYEIK